RSSSSLQKYWSCNRNLFFLKLQSGESEVGSDERRLAGRDERHQDCTNYETTLPMVPDTRLRQELGLRCGRHHFFRTHVLDMSVDVPLMPERTADRADAIAIKLIRGRAHHLRAQCHCVLDDAVHVLQIQQHRDRRAAIVLWRVDAHLRIPV